MPEMTEADWEAYEAAMEGPTCPICDGLGHSVCPLETNEQYRWEVEQDEARALF